MSMSRCSATVLTVCGSVGFVDPGMTCGWPQIFMMSGRVAAAGALRVEGVDRAAVDGPQRGLEVARLVEAVGVQRDLDTHLVGRTQRGVDRRGREPQSSCSL